MNTKSPLHFETHSFGLAVRTARLLPWALAGMLTGCLSHTAPVRQTFALETPPPTNSVAAKGQAVLAIRTLQVSPLFAGRSLVYRTGAERYELDPYAGFLVDPTHALAIPMRRYLRNPGAFKDVVEPGSQLEADTFLEVYVSELYGDLRPSNPPAAVLSMRMLFFAAGSEKMPRPFLERNYTHRVPLRQKTAASLVAAWNQALAQAMTELAADLASAQAERANKSP